MRSLEINKHVYLQVATVEFAGDPIVNKQIRAKVLKEDEVNEEYLVEYTHPLTKEKVTRLMKEEDCSSWPIVSQLDII